MHSSPIPPLQVVHLSKSYKARHGGAEVEAVRGVSFEVAPGECFGLLGPNGAGKSTTIQCISGFYPPSAGEVRVAGYNVHSQPKLARKSLGVCNQEETLDSDFNAFDQLVLQAGYFRIPVVEGKKRAHELLGKQGSGSRTRPRKTLRPFRAG